MGTTKYIMSMGELYRKDNSLCFRKNGQNVYIPVENTKEIYCLNEVTVNTKLWIFEAKIMLLFFFNYITVFWDFLSQVNITVDGC